MSDTVEELVSVIGVQAFAGEKCPLALRARAVRETMTMLSCWLSLETKPRPYNFAIWFARPVPEHYFDRPDKPLGKETIGKFVRELVAEIAPPNERLRMLLFHYLRSLWIRYDAEETLVYSTKHAIFAALDPLPVLLAAGGAKDEVSQLRTWRKLAGETLANRESQPRPKGRPRRPPAAKQGVKPGATFGPAS